MGQILVQNITYIYIYIYIYYNFKTVTNLKNVLNYKCTLDHWVIYCGTYKTVDGNFWLLGGLSTGGTLHGGCMHRVRGAMHKGKLSMGGRGDYP